jgi:CRISPR-associated protein Csx10
MTKLSYLIHLLEPLLVAQADTGEENSAISLPFIPGSTIRGALISRYLQRNPTSDPASDEITQRLFFNGSVCYLNAYPWQEPTRLLPKPLSWFTEKIWVDLDGVEIRDMAVKADPDTPDSDPEQPKPPSGEFCWTNDTNAMLYTPPRQVNVHIALEDSNRRDERNQVFRYDALAEGEVFAGIILAEADDDLKTIQSLFEPREIHFGRAHTAGYGRVKIDIAKNIDHSWIEYIPNDELKNGDVAITLLSDAILRGAKGQVGSDVLPALARALGLSHNAVPKMRFYRMHLVAGFNRKWSLPLVQNWALKSGSVFVYPSKAVGDVEALRDSVAKGIGERCVEGFGRVAINWQAQPVLRRKSYYPSKPLSRPPLSQDSKEIARQMAERRLRILLDRKLVTAVNDVNLKMDTLPKNAQLSRVRTAAQQALLKGDIDSIFKHMANLNKGAKRQFEVARADNISLLQWINDRIENLDIKEWVWQSDIMPSVAGETTEITKELKVEYTARLIDGVMKKAIRYNKKEVA